MQCMPSFYFLEPSFLKFAALLIPTTIAGIPKVAHRRRYSAESWCRKRPSYLTSLRKEQTAPPQEIS